MIELGGFIEKGGALLLLGWFFIRGSALFCLSERTISLKNLSNIDYTVLLAL
jgi:hypothetical protein